MALTCPFCPRTPKDKVIVYHGEFLGTSLQGDGRFTTVEEPYAAKQSALLCELYTEQCKRWDVRRIVLPPLSAPIALC